MTPNLKSELLDAMLRFGDLRRAGSPPDLVDFAGDFARSIGRDLSASELRKFLAAILPMDLERRCEAWAAGRKRGQAPTLDEYVASFPQLGPLSQWPAELILAEYKIRSRWGDRPLWGDFSPRFSGRCEGLLPFFWKIEADLRPSLPDIPGYDVIELIGFGAYADVYKAIPHKLKNHVAIKVLRTGTQQDPASISRFDREAEAISTLGHDHIIKILKYGHESGYMFIVFEYLEKGSLQEQISKGPVAVKWAAEIVASIADAVDAMHTFDMIHRDIKPANILLDNKNRAKIGDFGLVHLANSELTPRSDMVGTVHYMAPEQVSRNGGGPSPQTDVYSLGAVLYALLSGHPPFMGRTPAEVMAAVIHEAPAGISELRKAVPKDLITICEHCLQKRAADRLPSAAALRDELRRFLNHEPLKIRPYNPLARTRFWIARRPSQAAILALSVIAAILGGFGATFWNQLGLSGKLNASLTKDKQEAEKGRDRAIKLNETLTKDKQEAEKGRERALDEVVLKENLRKATIAKTQYDRAEAAFRAGKISESLLWMVESWRTAIESRDQNSIERARYALGLFLAGHADLNKTISPERKPSRSHFGEAENLVLTCFDDAQPQIWSTIDARPIASLAGSKSQISAAAFSSDGKVVLTMDADATAKLWSVATGRQLGEPLSHRELLVAAFSPNGECFITLDATDGLRLRSARDGEPIPSGLERIRDVTALAFSPSGRILLTGDANGIARLWSTRTGTPIGKPMMHPAIAAQSLPAPTSRLEPPTASKRGPRPVASGGKFGDSKNFSIYMSGSIFNERNPRGVVAVAFSPDGEIAVTGGWGRPRFWSASSGEPLGPPLDENFGDNGFEYNKFTIGAKFSPDGRSLITLAGEARLRPTIWSVPDGRFVGQLAEEMDRQIFLRRNAVKGTPDILTDLVHAPCGRLVADNSLALGYPTTILDLISFSPDGKKMLVPSFRSVRMFSTDSGKPLARPIEFDEGIRGATLDPTGRKLVVWTRAGGLVWDTDSTDKREPIFTASPANDRIMFSQDGSMLLTCTSSEVRIWSVDKGLPIGQPLRHPGPVGFMAFGPQSRSIVSESGELAKGGRSRYSIPRIWSTSLGTTQRAPLGYRRKSSSDAVVMSPDASRVVEYGTLGLSARIFSAVSGKTVGNEVKSEGMRNDTTPADSVIAFDKMGTKALIVLAGGTARLLSTSTGEKIGKDIIHFRNSAKIKNMYRSRIDRQINRVAMSPDGRTAITCGNDRTVYVWDLGTSEMAGALEIGNAQVASAAFSPDGKSVAIGTSDGAIQFYSIASLEPIGDRLRYENAVTALAFDPEGKRLVSGASDGSCRVWTVTADGPSPAYRSLDEPDRSLRTSIDSISISQDGKIILAKSSFGGSRLRFAADGRPFFIKPDRGDSLEAVGFSSSGGTIVGDGNRFWTINELQDDVERASALVRTITGTTLDREEKLTPIEQ